MRFFLACRVTAPLAAACALSVSAGPIWCEKPDAGSLPGSSQAPIGSGPLVKIMGKLAGPSSATGADFEDMFLIHIVDPLAFRASTVPADGGAAEFNTQLWLFKPAPEDCLVARGLLANDDFERGGDFSRLLPISTDGSGAQLTEPGIYYLAITGGPENDPLSKGGPIFNQADPTEVSGPDGPGGPAPVTAWSGGSEKEVGEYEIIFMEGTVEFPNGCCQGDVDADGVVGFTDLLEVLSHWGPCP